MLKRVFHAFTYGILFLLILLLADFYKQPLFLFLLMLLIALPPASYFVCKHALASMQPFLRTSSLYGISGGEIVFHIGLHNSSVFPIPSCTLSYELTSSFYPCDELFTCTIPAYNRQDFSFDMPVTFKKSGCYQLKLTHIDFYDYLHFFHFEKDVSILKEIVIHPKQAEDISFDSASFGEGFDEFEESDAKGTVSSNVTDIREYIPGDRLQRIHWKLSAKIDKLMVKENEQTSSNQFTILVELFLPEPESDVLEQSLSNAYTMARELLAHGETFFFCYYCKHEEDFAMHLIKTKEDLEQALLNCFYQSPYTEENFALDLLEKAGLLKGTILHISGKGVKDIVS